MTEQVINEQAIQQAASLLPGETFESDKSVVRITEGFAPPAGELPLVMLYEQAGLCAWVGKKDSTGKVLDAAPIFIANESGTPLTTLEAGMVLLTDFARDVAIDNRFSSGNFIVPGAYNIDDHVKATYGKVTLDYLKHQWVNVRLQPSETKYMASRMARILRINYLPAAKLIKSEKGRVLLDKPFTVLTKVESETILKDLFSLAIWMGEKWIEAESALISRMPHLSDRSSYFAVE